MTTPELFQKVIDAVLDPVMGSAQTNYPVTVDNKTTTPVALMCEKMIEAAKNTVVPTPSMDAPKVFNWTNINALAAGYNAVNK